MLDDRQTQDEIDSEELLHESKFLTFPIEDSMYGIDIQYVLEVVIRSEQVAITKVPHTPKYTKGVINLRGKVIPIIDLRTRFNLEERVYDNRTCFVVVDIHGVTTGLTVDTVSGVVTIPVEEIDLPPQLESSIQTKFIAGMGKTKNEVYIILNVQHLLYDEEINALKTVVEQ